jgi:hypothetical protein
VDLLSIATAAGSCHELPSSAILQSIANLFLSHVLELENRIKWLEDIIRSRCPDVDLAVGPTVELRSRPSPPAIRIVTTGPDFHAPPPLSAASSPIFALSPASTCATPVSFDFSSPGVSPGYLQPMSPFTFSDAGLSPAPSPGPSSPLMQARDTMPHEVGLLSLSGQEESKYVGPSSGISFARMVFADAGAMDLPNPEEKAKDASRVIPRTHVEPVGIPSQLEHCMALSKPYFETVHLQYPFLHQPTFEACLCAILQEDPGRLPPGYTLTTAKFQVLLVISIGAHILSTRTAGMPRGLNSDGFYAAALELCDVVSLTGRLQGVQSLLLLAMRTLFVTDGWNMWYLNAIIIASCIDLGLHCKAHEEQLGDGQFKAAMKRRVFWSAYSLDRSIGVALGRPFCIQDEALDVDLPNEYDNDEEISSAQNPVNQQSSNASRASFACSIYIISVNRIISNIKNTLYLTSGRSQNANWYEDWQKRTYGQLLEVQEDVRNTLNNVRRGSGQNIQLPSAHLAELKILEAFQLLFRPNGIFRRPTAWAHTHCFNAAVDTIRAYYKPKQRIHQEPSYSYPYTRLTEASILLSGITMLYTHRNCREVREIAANEVLAEEIRACSSLLSDLAALWPKTAKKSKKKFDTIAQGTLAYSAATTSSRMLSPHDAPRRQSNSSIRSFAETLEVPGATTPLPHLSTEWFPSHTPEVQDISWHWNSPMNSPMNTPMSTPMSTPMNMAQQQQNWDTQLAPEDLMINGMEGSAMEIPGPNVGMMQGMMGDTQMQGAMWSMNPGQQRHEQERQR